MPIKITFKQTGKKTKTIIAPLENGIALEDLRVLLDIEKSLNRICGPGLQTRIDLTGKKDEVVG